MQLIYPSLIQWCADTIATIIVREGWSKNTSIQMPGFKPDQQKLGLVTSPIPLWIAAQQKESPEKIGAILVAELQQVDFRHAPKCWLHSNHWLYLQFSDTALADWLQRCYLVTEPRLIGRDRHNEPPATPSSISEDPSIFALQYAHARCCSLLRLATENLIIELPNRVILPWINSAQFLNFSHPAEQNLIRFLLQFSQEILGAKTIHGISYTTAPGYQSDYSDIVQPKQLQPFGKAFLTFYRDCQIFNSPSKSQLDNLHQRILLRLALIQMTQRLLKFSLHQFLNCTAPDCL
jgi:hypothetical protein